MRTATPIRLVVPVLALACATFCSGVLAAPPPNPKADALVADLSKATTLDQVAQAFRRANLSQAELQQLKPRLEGPIGNKIQQLIRRQKPGRMASLQAARERELRLFETKKQQYLAKVEQARTQGDRQAAAALSRARSAAQHAPPAGRLVMKAPPRPTPEPTGATITSVMPDPAVIGQRLTIAGSGFGASRGTAQLLVGPRDRFPCDVLSWSNTQVVVTAPLAAEPLVRAGRQPGYIWIKLAGRDAGPFQAIDVAPDPARLTPVITGATPSSLRAMQTFLIEGRNFGPAAGRAVLQFRHGRASGQSVPDLDVELQIEEWRDTYIYARLRWEADVRDSQPVILAVTNDLGQTGTRTLEFVQEKVQYRLTRGLDRVHCDIWDNDDDEPSWVCWAGNKNTQAFSWGECRGGTVVDYGLTTLDDGGISSGCRYVDRPNGIRWSGSVEVWADLFSWVDCEVWMVVEAVRGHECR
ncbi:MAG: IPT/TIG domain-containing protein [Acidobacteriota bacterium]